MHDIERILTAAARALKAEIELSCAEGDIRTGAYVCVMDLEYGLLLHEPIGHGQPNKLIKWRGLSAEKCIRLLGNRRLGHQTSFESKNEALLHYPGAILGESLVWSASGLRALSDEAAMFAAAIEYGDLERDAVLALYDEARNPRLRPLLARLGMNG